MPRIGDEELKLWKRRLEHADGVWKENGATGEGRNNIFEYFESYRNAIWGLDGFAGIPRSSLPSVPLTFSLTRTQIAQFSARFPRPTVRPKGRTLAEPRAALRSQVNEIIIDSYMRDLGMKQQVDDAMLHSLLGPAGIIRHGYSPPEETFDADGNRIETFDPAVPDAPWIRMVPIWDTRIDPLASTWRPKGDAEWAAFRVLRTMEQVRRNPNLVKRRDLRPTKSADTRRLKTRHLRRSEGPDFTDLVESWVIYDKVERKWLEISPGAERPIREPDDWPLPWATLPFDALFYNPQPDSPFPIPFPRLYHSLVELYNKLTAILYGCALSTRRKVFVNDDALKEGEEAKLGDFDEQMIEYLLTNGADPHTIMAEVKAGQVPQELIVLQQNVKEEIREILGQSQLDRAQRINVESATEANFVQSGSMTQRIVPQERVEEFWGSILEHWHEGFQETQTEDVLIPVVGSERAREIVREPEGVLQIPPDLLRGEFHYGVRAGSTLAEDPANEARKLVAYKSAMAESKNVNQFELDREITQAFRLDPERMLNSQQQAQTQLSEQLLQGAQGREPGGVDANALRALEPNGGSQ